MTLPTAPQPQGRYVPASRHENLIFTAGMTPRRQGKLIATGRIQAGEDLSQHREAVRLATSNALVATRSVLEPSEAIVRVLNMVVYIAAASDFVGHSAIADFASELLVEELGVSAVTSRTAVGVYTLPSQAPVEVSLVAVAGVAGASAP